MVQGKPNARLGSPDPSSVISPSEQRSLEEHGGNGSTHQASEPTGTQQPGSPKEIEKTIQPQLPPKGPRASISVIETLPELSKEQLATLRDILSLIEVTSTSKVEFIWSSVLQLAGLLFVVVFGVFAALAYDAANIANKQSSQANQLALLNLCMSQNSPSDTCVAVQQNRFDSLDSLATAILGPGVVLTTSTLSPSSTPTSTSSTTNSNSVTSGSSSSTTTSPSDTSQSTTIAPSSTTAGTQTATPTQSSSSLQNGSSGGSRHHFSTPALVGTIVGVVLSVISISISGCAFYVRFAQKRRRKFVSEAAMRDMNNLIEVENVRSFTRAG